METAKTILEIISTTVSVVGLVIKIKENRRRPTSKGNDADMTS